jgi:integrase
MKVYAGLDPLTGRRLYLTGSSTNRRTAEKIRTRLLADVDAKRNGSTRGTLTVAIDKWLSVHEVEAKTMEDYRGHIERVIRPALGSAPVTDVTVQVLEELYGDLRRCSKRCRGGEPAVDHRTGMPHECRVVKHKRPPGRPRSGAVHDCSTAGCTVVECPPHTCRPLGASGVRQVHWILSSVLAAAVRWGWITSNPAEVAKKPRKPPADPDPPSTADAARIVDAAWEISPDWGVFVWLVYVTGMRRAETIALRWSRIDLDAGKIAVRRNWVSITGQGGRDKDTQDAPAAADLGGPHHRGTLDRASGEVRSDRARTWHSGITGCLPVLLRADERSPVQPQRSDTQIRPNVHGTRHRQPPARAAALLRDRAAHRRR